MILQSCEALTPAFATQLLKLRDVLHSGEVTDVQCSEGAFNKGYVANLARATLHYSPDATGVLPTSLVLKLSRADLHPELLNAGRHEVEFYRATQSQPKPVSIPLIYSAEVDEANSSHIIMQDLSDSHFQKPLPIPPSNRHCELIVESLAKLHALWWNSPQLGMQLGTRYTEQEAIASEKRLQDTYPRFVDYLGDALLPAQRRMYEKVLASDLLWRLSKRLIEQHNVTVVHGDVHTGNVLLPKFERDPVVLIDWHRWAIDLGTFDLAFMIALHWSAARRAILEKALVRHYYEVLVEHGVSNVTWEACWDDYRAEVIVTMLIPIGQFRRGSPPGVIWFGLQDSWAAVQDLDCESLL
jgi:aminoglycoside phosphotransferase (APT) family kinase protein